MGCDGLPSLVILDCFDFNPRIRVGCDLIPAGGDWRDLEFQSTHPRGMRHQLDSFLYALQYFNPRIRVGCDLLSGTPTGGKYISIHASAWDATFLLSTCTSTLSFQSTHPRGMRLLDLMAGKIGHLISIHASAWDATLMILTLLTI